MKGYNYNKISHEFSNQNIVIFIMNFKTTIAHDISSFFFSFFKCPMIAFEGRKCFI